MMRGPVPIFLKTGMILQIRVLEFDYRQLSDGLFNIRVGYVFVPFGPRRDINTTGTCAS